MQAGLTAVTARPLRLRADQPHTGAIGIVVHGVVGADQRVNVGAGEELGRGVRTFGDRDLPAMPDAWLLVDRRACRTAVEWSRIDAGRQHIGFTQRPTAVATERAERECGCAAQAFGFLQGAGHQHVAAHSWAGQHRDVEHSAGWDRDRLPLRHRRAVQCHAHRRAGDAHASAVRKPKGGTASRTLESGCAFGIAQHPVADPERQVVHRPGRRHADMPVPDASGPVVHSGQHPGPHHLDRGH
jgi:hypothetical protein